jgi:hypothetical protein
VAFEASLNHQLPSVKEVTSLPCADEIRATKAPPRYLGEREAHMAALSF